MIIILEGCDKTGKTTLAVELSKKLGTTIYKSSQPVKPPFLEYMDLLDDIGDGNAIIDRFHLGELVYGPIYRNKSMLDHAELKMIEDRLLKLDTLLIYCYDTVDNIAQRFKADNEEFSKSKDIKRILSFYDGALGQTKLNTIKHKMKSDYDLTKLLKML